MGSVNVVVDRGEVKQSQVLYTKDSILTVIKYESSEDGKVLKVVTFEGAAICLEGDEIIVFSVPGAKFAIFGGTHAFKVMLDALYVKYGINFERLAQMTPQDIEAIEDEAQTIDTEFAHSTRNLKSLSDSATKIYDVTRKIIYWRQ